MQVLDYIILGGFAIGMIIGLVKGLWSQLFNFVGVFVVSIGTGYLYQYPMQWFSKWITDPTVLSIVALIATFIVLSIVYGIISHLLKKLFTSIKVLKVLDKLFGMLLGIGIAYSVFAIAISFIDNSTFNLIVMLKEKLGTQWTESWVINNIYANNFFGDWLLQLVASMFPQPEQPEALAILPSMLIK